jgi:hypothetical protein
MTKRRREPLWVVLDRAVTRNARQPRWGSVLIILTTVCVLLFGDELGAWSAWIYAVFGLVYLAVRTVRPRAVSAFAGPYPLFDAAALGLMVLLLLLIGGYYPIGVTIALGAAVLGILLALAEICRRRERGAQEPVQD